MGQRPQNRVRETVQNFTLNESWHNLLSCFLWRGVRYTAHERIMKLTEQFRQNADEWRQIEKIAASDEHRRRIAEVADAWLAWAELRERMLGTEEHTKPDEHRS